MIGKTLIPILLSIFILTGCASGYPRSDNAIGGALAGGMVGGVVGAGCCANPPAGIAIGALVGAAAGGITGLLWPTKDFDSKPTATTEQGSGGK